MSLLWVQATGRPRLLHASDSVFSPGDEITPASVTGHQSRWEHLPTYSPHHVYMFHPDADPISYEEHGAHLYEVEPLGDVERDPEWAENRKKYPVWNDATEEGMTDDEVPGYHSYRAPKARVIRKIH